MAAERSLRRSCAGRIVIMLTPITIVGCAALYGLSSYLLYRAGLAQGLPGELTAALTVGCLTGLVVTVALAWLAGNWLRHSIWRALYRRAMRPRSMSR